MKKSPYAMTPELRKLILGKGEIKPTSVIMADPKQFWKNVAKIAKAARKNPNDPFISP